MNLVDTARGRRDVTKPDWRNPPQPVSARVELTSDCECAATGKHWWRRRSDGRFQCYRCNALVAP